MVAVQLDDDFYIKSYSHTHRKPGMILVDSFPNEEDPGKLRCYKFENGKFAFDPLKWAALQAERIKEEAERAAIAAIEKVRGEIKEFKENLESTDYQIIKCFEYSLLNIDLPYDLEKLHTERQAMRDKINALEEALNNKQENECMP